MLHNGKFFNPLFFKHASVKIELKLLLYHTKVPSTRPKLQSCAEAWFVNGFRNKVGNII